MVCEPQYPDIETFFRLHSTKRIILYILLHGAINFQFGLSALETSYAEENRSPAMKAQDCSSNMLKFKCWYYEQAIKDGSEDRLKTLIPDRLPEEIRKAYENAHR